MLLVGSVEVMGVLLAILPALPIAFIFILLTLIKQGTSGILTGKFGLHILWSLCGWVLLATLIACAINITASSITRPTLSLIDKQSEVNQHKQQATVVEIPTLIDNTRKSEGVEVTTQLVDEIKGGYLSKLTNHKE